MNLIVAVDENWAIGSNGDLLIRIPADHKFFRQETTGKVVVLGRKTLETFPQGMPLKNRTNIIMSTNPAYQVKDALVVHDVDVKPPKRGLVLIKEKFFRTSPLGR